MNCVDFDKHFQTYLRQWTQQNMGRVKNVDEMEAEVPEVYLRWLNEPCDWLSGRTPGDYFEQFDDAKFLCKWLSDYVKKKVPVPDQLMERITALGEESVPELIAIAAVAGLHLWKRNVLLSIAGGTVLYMVLVQAVFV